MIQSMTGFEEKRFYSKTFSAKISIRTLNHRFLDWNYRGNQIGGVENRLRAICQKKLHRGRVDVSIELNFSDPARWDLRINENLLHKILFSMEKIASRMHKKASFSVENVFGIPHIIELERKDFTREEVYFLERSFEKTLDEVKKKRIKEGRDIGREIRKHVRKISHVLNRIEKLAIKQPFLMREKLRQKLKELEHEVSLSDEKLAEEVAYYAQRYDLTEEIVRLKFHLDHVKELLSPNREEPAGRQLDFIAQELYREANTINSKAQDVEIIKNILIIKGEVESIRQQIQNVE